MRESGTPVDPDDPYGVGSIAQEYDQTSPSPSDNHVLKKPKISPENKSTVLFALQKAASTRETPPHAANLNSMSLSRNTHIKSEGQGKPHEVRASPHFPSRNADDRDESAKAQTPEPGVAFDSDLEEEPPFLESNSVDSFQETPDSSTTESPFSLEWGHTKRFSSEGSLSFSEDASVTSPIQRSHSSPAPEIWATSFGHAKKSLSTMSPSPAPVFSPSPSPAFARSGSSPISPSTKTLGVKRVNHYLPLLVVCV